jgi:small subunit ribosomal protein S8
MSTTDPIADMLTRIRNALLAHHEVVEVLHSKLNTELARILKREGYISDYIAEGKGRRMVLRVFLKYLDNQESVIRGLRRVSKPGLRRYVKVDKIPRSLRGLGTVVLTTPSGILTDSECRKKNIGGEVLFEVW